MQIKLFTIPVIGGAAEEAALNVFLRSRKILQTEAVLAVQAGSAYWCFCIRYLDEEAKPVREKQRIDYMEVLDKESFNRFSRMREIRKRLATEEASYWVDGFYLHNEVNSALLKNNMWG